MERGGGRLSFTDTCHHRHLTFSPFDSGTPRRTPNKNEWQVATWQKFKAWHLSTSVYKPVWGLAVFSYHRRYYTCTVFQTYYPHCRYCFLKQEYEKYRVACRYTSTAIMLSSRHIILNFIITDWECIQFLFFSLIYKDMLQMKCIVVNITFIIRHSFKKIVRKIVYP